MEKLLIIEDSRVVQELLTEIFRNNFELDFASDGPSGVAAAENGSPDLILLDIHLPGMDGFEVCRILTGSELTRAIPIIIITSLDSEKDKVKGFAAGASDYVVKPFYREELEARVKAHLAFRKAKFQALELERLAVFREMAVAICHEINNPLTSVYAFLHVLQNELDGATDVVHISLEGIRKEIRRIEDITKELAHASRVTRTPYHRDISMIDLHKL